MREFQKIKIAEELLNTALYHYFETESYFASIHCAGAAEEILGEYVKKHGGETAFDSLNNGARRIGKAIDGEEPTRKQISFIMNYVKNSTKHMNGIEDDRLTLNPKGAAKNLLDRAVENFYYLFSRGEDIDLTAHIERFNRELVDV